MSGFPNLEFLKTVERGDIIVKISQTPGKGVSWSATGGLFILRRHEEAGFIEPILTAKWAGYPRSLYDGIPARLTEKAKHLLSYPERVDCKPTI